MKKKIVYIAHPVKGDELFSIEDNIRNIEKIVRHINLTYRDVCAIAPYYLDLICMSDNNSTEREIGISKNKTLIQSGVFDEIWLFGHKLSFGMRDEALQFLDLGKQVVNNINKIV